MAFDNFFKKLFNFLLKNRYHISVDHSIGQFPIRIDMLLEKKEKIKQKMEEKMKEINDSNQKQLNIFHIPIIENKLKKYNFIEYKSIADKRKKGDLSKLIGYVGLFFSKKDYELNQIEKEATAWYISAIKPKFISNLKEENYLEIIEKGLYKIKKKMPFSFYILILNEIDPNEENLILGLISGGRVYNRFIKAIMENKIPRNYELDKYISMSFFLYNKELENMVKEFMLTEEEVNENIKSAVYDIGLKRFVDIVGIEELIEVAGFEKVIEKIGFEKVIEKIGFEKVIEKIGFEKVIEVMGIEKLEKYLNEYKKKNKLK